MFGRAYLGDMEASDAGDKADVIFGSLTGVELQITTRYKNDYEYDIKIAKVNGSNGRPEYKLMGGYSVDLFFYLQSLLNFTYVIRPDVDAIKFDQASVENASIDLYLASFSLIMERAKYVEPTFVIGQSRILAFMDHAFEADSANQNIFIMPFNTTLWICTFALLAIFVASFAYFSRYEKDMSARDTIFHCISIVLQKDTDFPIGHPSTKVATFVLSFTVVIMMASYSGIMTSIFAVNIYSINSLPALINSKYDIMLETGAFSNTSTIMFMLEALTGISSVAALLKKAQRSRFTFTTFNDAILQVSKKPAAYIIDEETGLNSVYETIGEFPCSWSQYSVFNLRYPWSMYMRKNASFQRQINTGIVIIRERGILNRIRKKWIQQPAQTCESGGGSPFKSITFPKVKGAFTLLFIVMFAICPILFLIEKLLVFLVPKIKRDNITEVEEYHYDS